MCESTNPEENFNNKNDDFNIENSSEEEYNNEEDGESEVDDELTFEEMLDIDNKLDALNLALDAMESKREMVHLELLELLKSNQDVRKEIQEEQQMKVDVNDTQSETK
ncbi:hypothetical protein RN001_008141 [Aquatica leii]|uniref:Uncharacterized protein n=1 Tax=Aquatica leii TaxID=1421715 RepID=A0AAN7Q4X2_9COLE|nr:hypothetical protein RN001_008141 [Aquatica leii]